MSNIFFNFEKIGEPIAKIVGGKYNNKLVYLYAPLPNQEEEEITKPFKELVLTDGIFQPIPNPFKERAVGYLTGRSGSGKSYQTGKYLEQYKKQNKNNKIYLFSPVKEDDALDKYVKRIELDESLYKEPFTLEQFKDTCVIFDDTDTISNKKIKDAVYTLLNSILEQGRHHNITCLITNHLGADRNVTKRVLNECEWMCFFPNSGITANLKYTLENHLGLDKHQIQKIKDTNSRHAYVYKNYPPIVMTERNLYLLNEK